MKVTAFPFHDWNKGIREGFRTRDGHILQKLGRHPSVERLIVINRPRPRIERWVRRLPVTGEAITACRMRETHARVTRIGDRTYAIDIDTPDLLGPLRDARGWWFEVFSRPATLNALQWALAELDAQGSPAIAWTPTVVDAIVGLQPSRIVFDSLDNWLIHPVLRRSADRARAAYGKLLPVASRVFVVAPKSAAALLPWRTDVEMLPNGVDSEVFSRPALRPRDLPPGPVIGYAGKLAHRIDTQLVVEVAAQMPEAEFVFVGPILERHVARALRRRRNVRLLGDRHYDLVPAYVQHFDVAWIPHRVGEGETGGDPIKLYEYWAAGRPVVSTPIDGMDRWARHLKLVTDSGEACLAIRAMLERPIAPAVPREREWNTITDVLVSALKGQAQ